MGWFAMWKFPGAAHRAVRKSSRCLDRRSVGGLEIRTPLHVAARRIVFF